MRVSFGDFVLDLDRRQLVHDDQYVQLTPKALDLLAFLVAKRPRAVAKTEIRDHLWPGTFVSESNLTTLVTELRAALGDAARSSRFVKTVHRFGYAFCGDVVRAAVADEGASYRLIWGKREIALSEGENVLGRSHRAAVWIDSVSVSRPHARIVITADGATIQDLESKNGTYVGGKRLEGQPAPLCDGDVLKLGSVTMIFRVLQSDGSTATE